MTASCILWQNDAKTVVLLDFPRSIEEAQVLSGELTAQNAANPKKLRRLISALPPSSPFQTPEPKNGGSVQPASSHSAQIADLMTQAAVESALEEIKISYNGPWCLPRICSKPVSGITKPSPRTTPPSPPAPSPSPAHPTPSTDGPSKTRPSTTPSPTTHHLPSSSHPLPGALTTTRPIFLSTTTPHQFNLIILDPPWPNRSAKRKRAGTGAAPGSYRTLPDLSSTRVLLSQIPVASRLAPGGFVGVWVTNAGRFTDLLVEKGGIFAEWDVELVGEWTWLKVTSGGEPVVAVESGWRKPWERLLIGRRRGAVVEGGGGTGSVEGKVIVSVPDVHSRKPNLRCLFEELLPERYEALEVFARNLTAGWWAWGDEVLLFQRKECWVDVEEKGTEEEDGET